MALSLSQTDNNHLATSTSREYFPLIHQGRINCGHTAERNPKWARLSQSKPECVRTGQRESQSEPDRTRVSQREQVWARLDQRERESMHYIQYIQTLRQFCRETLKYSTFCRENVVYTLWAEKIRNLCGELTPQFIPPCTTHYHTWFVPISM